MCVAMVVSSQASDSELMAREPHAQAERTAGQAKVCLK
jgi:hypothetical protein